MDYQSGNLFTVSEPFNRSLAGNPIEPSARGLYSFSLLCMGLSSDRTFNLSLYFSNIVTIFTPGSVIKTLRDILRTVLKINPKVVVIPFNKCSERATAISHVCLLSPVQHLPCKHDIIYL